MDTERKIKDLKNALEILEGTNPTPETLINSISSALVGEDPTIVQIVFPEVKVASIRISKVGLEMLVAHLTSSVEALLTSIKDDAPMEIKEGVLNAALSAALTYARQTGTLSKEYKFEDMF